MSLAAEKKKIVYNTLLRLIAVIWGSLARRSHLLYNIVVYPTVLYGSQV